MKPVLALAVPPQDTAAPKEVHPEQMLPEEEQPVSPLAESPPLEMLREDTPSEKPPPNRYPQSATERRSASSEVEKLLNHLSASSGRALSPPHSRRDYLRVLCDRPCSILRPTVCCSAVELNDIDANCRGKAGFTTMPVNFCD